MWGYNYDIVFNNIIIEVQGTMWHAHPSKYKKGDLIIGRIPVERIWEKDARKLEESKKNNFKMVYLWEHDIRSLNDSDLEIFIKNSLKEVGYEIGKDCIN